MRVVLDDQHALRGRGAARRARGARLTTAARERSGSVNGTCCRVPGALSTRHAAALQLDEFLHQRQPEARAAELAPRRAVDLAELLEDHLVVLRVDADALRRAPTR